MVARRFEAPTKERILGAAGSFTGLWAMTWLGASAMGAAPALQGGFAVGGVMASSGLTVLWWKFAALRQMAEEKREQERAEAEAAEADAAT